MELLNKIRGGSLQVERSLFQVGKGGAVPTSPHQLELKKIRHIYVEIIHGHQFQNLEQ